MQLHSNKTLRHHGVYELQGQTLILMKSTETVAFLFSPESWHLHGPVEYRVSHGKIYAHGKPTAMTDEDLHDTGTTAEPPPFSTAR